jgi:hypothetical protein
LPDNFFIITDELFKNVQPTLLKQSQKIIWVSKLIVMNPDIHLFPASPVFQFERQPASTSVSCGAL